MKDGMIAIEIGVPGGPDALVAVRRAIPVPGHDQVLIRVAAAGVNRPDVMQRRGLYAPPAGASDIPGLEIAGEIVAAGPDIDTAVIGKQVCALVTGGGYAEYCLARPGHCLPIPDTLSMIEAAAMPETLFTVWSNLFERAYVVAGERVLIHGGTSGIGTMAIALCGLFDIETIVTCGSDAKCQAARELGADHAINYRDQDFVTEVQRITGGAGVNVVLDMVAGDYVPRNIACLADDGRHVTIAVQGGRTATIPMLDILIRRLTLTGSTLRPRSDAFKTAVADEISKTVWPLVEEGKLRPVIDITFPLAEAAAAHTRMEAGAHIGKIVLKVQER